MNRLLRDDHFLMTANTAISVTIVVGSYYLYNYTTKQHANRPWKRVPGSVPFLGHFPYIGGIPNLVAKLEEWAAVYGNQNGCFEIDMPGGVSHIVVCREDRVLEILQQRPRKVVRPIQIRESTESVGAKGIFSAQGEHWKQEHRLVGAALNRRNTEEYLPILQHMVNRLISKWENAKESSDYGNKGTVTVTINADLGGMTADSIGKVMLDSDFDFLNHPESRVAKDTRTITKGALNRALCPIWYWRIPVIGQFLDGVGFAARNLWNVVSTAVIECEEAATSTTAVKSTFLQKLISMVRSEKSNMPRDRIIGNALTLFIAGTDTTEKSLVQALFLLATNPDIQQDLRNEVADFDWKNASYDDLYTKVPRLKSFLHETHRQSVMPIMMLSTAEEIPFCGTTLLAGQDMFLLNRYCSTQTATSCTKDVPTMGDSEINETTMPANEFHPYRYLVKDEKTEIVSCPDPNNKTTGYLSFGYGARMCPGRRYSEILSYSALIAILQTFDLKLAPNHPPFEHVYDAIAMSPSCDIQLQLTKTKSDQ